MLIGIFITGTVIANTPVPASKSAIKEVSKYLKEELTYPNFAFETNLEGSVVVSMLVQEDGSLKVEQANCKSCYMRNHVIKEINNLKNKNFEKYANQNVIVNIKFYLIE